MLLAGFLTGLVALFLDDFDLVVDIAGIFGADVLLVALAPIPNRDKGIVLQVPTKAGLVKKEGEFAGFQVELI